MTDAADIITLASCKIEPNECPLGSEMTVRMTFKTSKPIAKGVWDLKYMVDMASKRKLIPLGQTAESSYSVGQECSMEISVPKIDTSGFKPHHLANAGLVVATLMDGDEEVVAINMVTQVTKNEQGELCRTVYSPLEE